MMTEQFDLHIDPKTMLEQMQGQLRTHRFLSKLFWLFETYEERSHAKKVEQGMRDTIVQWKQDNNL